VIRIVVADDHPLVRDGLRYLEADEPDICVVAETPHEHLAERELAVIRLLGGGRTVSEIAEQLSRNRKTISTYRARLLEKLSLCNNADLARYAVKHQLLE